MTDEQDDLPEHVQSAIQEFFSDRDSTEPEHKPKGRVAKRGKLNLTITILQVNDRSVIDLLGKVSGVQVLSTLEL